MSGYTDGFVIALPRAKIEDYRKMAEVANAVWKEYGALDYVECVGEDLEVQECASFQDVLSLKEDETVVFAWIRFESREHRDRVNAAVMKDPRVSQMCGASGADAPFDPKRMIYGGFEVIVENGPKEVAAAESNA